MLSGGERVVVAVSGGADSVALLHVLRELRQALALSLHVAHVDHRLRADSDRDARFVTDLAARFALPVDVLPVDVPSQGSPEDAARRARYAALEALADRIGADRIAVAHTADDQAETVLMRVLEGAGPGGLAGIPPRRGRIIRPFIEARRSDVVGALAHAALEWREDPTNVDRRFLRNRVRHDILPMLAKERPDIVAALARTARLARESRETMERLAADELARVAIIERDGIVLPLDRLRALPRELAAEVLQQSAARLGTRAPMRAWAHRGLRRVLAAPEPRRPFRLSGVTVEVSSKRVRLSRGPRPPLPPRSLSAPGTTALPEAGVVIIAELLDRQGFTVPRDPRIVAFDADALGPLTVRGRRRGDRFLPFGSVDRKLTHFLIGAKVPRWERATVPLVDAAGTIVWVAGVRRGAAAPVTAATRRVLRLSVRPLADVAADR